MVKACRRVLVEVSFQLFVELRVFFPDLPGFLEEGFGRDGEKLRRVRSPVFAEYGLLPLPVHGHQLFIFLRHDPDPCGMLMPAAYGRGPINEIIQHVQLVSKLVDDDIAPVLPIFSSRLGALPGKDDDVDIRVGRAEDFCFTLYDDSSRAPVSRGYLVGAGVDQDFIDTTVEMVLDSQEEEGCLGRDRYLHLFGNLEAVEPPPDLIVDEDAGDGEKAFLFIPGKGREKGERLDPGQPVVRELPVAGYRDVSSRASGDGRELLQESEQGVEHLVVLGGY